MCGIAGIFDLGGGAAVDRALLERMNDRLSHRGPDGSGFHVEPGVGFGHRRLSIIDLAGGRQPMYNETGSVVVTFNGEIYNFIVLRRELERAGHRFQTNSDTEVIVHGWEEWGAAVVERLAGMFAFALWDRDRQTLLLARDRLGKKPLYYARVPNGQLIFASELKSLLVHPLLPRRLRPSAVEDYFTFGYVPDPATILEGVYKLPPASTLEVRRGQPLPQPKEYWDLRFNPAPQASESDACNELIERLREAVRCRLISEVPLGAFLSGGVDSSAVVALMAGISREPVNTCSISFGERAYDESRFAEMVAQRYHTRQAVERVAADDYGLIDELVRVYDEPFADSSAIPTYRVCELARKHVTVALSGDAGDENFGGYRRYKWHVHEERVRRLLPARLRRGLFGLAGRWYPKLDWAPRVLRAKATLEALARDSVQGYLHSVSIMGQDMRARLFHPDFSRALQGYSSLEVFRRHAQRAPLDQPLAMVQYLDFKTYLPGDILVKVDRASMAHSLEVRVPMLDHRFVEWAATLPQEWKLKGAEGKYLFKKSLEPLLPREVLYRPKMGFAVPLAQWFRGPLRDQIRERLLQSELAESGIFSANYLRQLVDEHQSGSRDHSSPLWALLMFEGFQRSMQETAATGGERNIAA